MPKYDYHGLETNKNILFLDWETKQLDSGKTNIEDEG